MSLLLCDGCAVFPLLQPQSSFGSMVKSDQVTVDVYLVYLLLLVHAKADRYHAGSTQK